MPARSIVSCVEVISPELVMVIDSPDGLFALMPRWPENAIEPSVIDGNRGVERIRIEDRSCAGW